MMTSESSLLGGSASLCLVVPVSRRRMCLCPSCCRSRGMCVERGGGSVAQLQGLGGRLEQGAERRGGLAAQHSDLTL